MHNLKLLIAVSSAIVTLSGCAVFGNCGNRDCPGDAKITARIEGLFTQHAELEPPNLLTVQTIDHVVYLYGLVATDLQRESADEVAWEATGVTKVVDSIAVINK